MKAKSEHAIQILMSQKTFMLINFCQKKIKKNRDSSKKVFELEK